jgi:hypothetical protein
MDAFLTNFLDVRLIHRWICVDDNSSAADRSRMSDRYPFFEFVWKTPDQKGHSKSMQMITSMVNTPYLLHMEDDMMLLDKAHYIADMIDILNEGSIGQVVFNQNYVETMSDVVVGGCFEKTANNVFYVMHEYCQTTEEKEKFTKKYIGPFKTVNHWPHFSLNPSLLKTSIFEKVAFKDEPQFEANFALRYVDAGYKTAFLPGARFRHIGRLLREANILGKYNAYDLLNTDK